MQDDCQKCELSTTRTKIVWGSGDANAEVMFIGEAPGKSEDEGGIPFTGAAGKQLDAFLERARLERDQIFITSTIKCRPPKNRNPTSKEIAACVPHLLEQIEAINPRIIVTLGAIAMHTLTGDKQPMAELQGRVHTLEIGGKERTVLATYHPAAILYRRGLMTEFLQAADLLTDILAPRVKTFSEAETSELGKKLALLAQPGDVAVLSGDLAAGKTHFAQGFAYGLGIERNVPSPTFNIVLEYHSGRLPFYHFDLYRLNQAEELEDIDFYSIVESDGVSLIEWGEKFSDSLSAADLVIQMETTSETERTLTFLARTVRGQEWIATYV